MPIDTDRLVHNIADERGLHPDDVRYVLNRLLQAQGVEKLDVEEDNG